MRRQPRVRSKYGAIRETVDNITFASKAEARRYRELRLLERSGAITGLVTQPSYELLAPFTDNEGKRHRAVKYVGDFFYYEGLQPVCEDVKGGAVTREFALKSKFFRAKYPGIRFSIVRNPWAMNSSLA